MTTEDRTSGARTRQARINASSSESEDDAAGQRSDEAVVGRPRTGRAESAADRILSNAVLQRWEIFSARRKEPSTGVRIEGVTGKKDGREAELRS
jgi:hypothetical protein